jgi:hypothetical protein
LAPVICVVLAAAPGVVVAGEAGEADVVTDVVGDVAGLVVWLDLVA